MPASFTIDHDNYLVRARAIGVVDMNDAFQLMTAINQHPDYKKGMGTLLDMRNTSVNVKVDQLMTLAEAVRKLTTVRGKVGIALITDSDLTYGMSRMVGSSLGEEDIKVAAFRQESEAIQWLHEVAEGSGYFRRRRADDSTSESTQPS